MPRRARALAVAVLAFAAWSCRDLLVDPGSGGTPGSARTLRIAPSRLDLAVGASATVTATLLDATGAAVDVPAGYTLTFTSSAPGVFVADPQGVTTGVAAGEGVLRAAVGALAVGIPVRVAASGARLVILGGDAQTGAPGAELALPLRVRAIEADGRPGRDAVVNWEASAGAMDPARTVTDGNGETTTRWTLGATAGPQSVTASATGFASVTFVATAVVRPVASIVVAPATVALTDVAQTAQLVATARDADGQPVPAAGFLWTSSNAAVATVTQAGLVTAVGAGTSTVSASLGAISGASAVTVTLPLPQARIAFSPDTLKATVVAGAEVVGAVDVREAGGQPSSTLGTVTCDAPAYEGGPPSPWLVVQACGDSVRVLVQAAALPAGTWRATIPVRGALASNSPAALPVEVVVTPAPVPVIAASPAGPQTFAFTLGQGVSFIDRDVQITNAGGGTLTGLASTVTYAAGQPRDWVESFSLTSSTAPSVLRLQVLRDPLSAGTYDATVRITSTVAGVQPLDIPIRVVVTAAAAQIGFVPGVVAGVGYTNGPDLRVAVDVVELTGLGEAALGEVRCLTQTGNPEYFLLATCGDSIVYVMRTGGNFQGEMEGSLRVTAANIRDTVTLPLRLTVARAQFRTVPDSLALQAQANGAPVRAAAALVIDVLPGAPAYPEETLGALECTLVSPEGAPTAAVARCDADSVAVVVTPGAAAGSYRYTVRVRAPEAPVTVLPVTMPVNVTVAPVSGPPIIAVSPAGPIEITTPFGNDGVTLNRWLTITNAGGGTLTGLSAFVTYGSEQRADWIETGFDSTTAPTAMYVDVFRFMLPPGTYDATIRIASTVAGVQPVVIPVRVTVVAPTARIGLDPDSMVVTSYTGGPRVRAAVAVVERTGQGRAALGTISCSAIDFVEIQGWATLVSCGDSVVVQFTTENGFNGVDRATIRVTGSSVADTATLRLTLRTIRPQLAFVPDSLAMTLAVGGAPVQASARVFDAEGLLTPSQLGPLLCTITAPAGAPPATVTACSADAVTVRVTPGATTGTFRYTVLVRSLNGTTPIEGAELTVRVTVTPAAAPFTAALLYGTCAVVADGRLYCWGDNARGQLGDGTTTRRLRPSLMKVPASGLAFVNGEFTRCARGLDVLATYCWGDNASGATGVGTFAGSTLEPTRVTLSGLTFGAPAVGARTACTRVDDGTSDRLYCWGANDFGQLGNGSVESATSAPTTRIALDLLFTHRVAVGATHACVIASNGGGQSLWCWGQGWLLGNGTTSGAVRQGTPVNVSFPDDLGAQLVAGDEATCLTNFNSVAVYCWGSNTHGEAGSALDEATGAGTVVGVPTRLTFPGLPASAFVRDVAMGREHGCAIVAGATYCWGRNQYGQLGHGSAGDARLPRRIANDPGFDQIEVSGNTTCGITFTGEVWCWGYGQTGELGDGTEGRNSAVPVRVVQP